MTREDKLYSMTMANLEIVADKLGIKINKKGSKAKAIEKILEAEHMVDETDKVSAQEEQAQEDIKEAEEEMKRQYASNEDEPENKPAPTTPKRGALLEYHGKSQNICAWAKELGKSANTLYARIYKLGWTIEKAFES